MTSRNFGHFLTPSPLCYALMPCALVLQYELPHPPSMSDVIYEWPLKTPIDNHFET